VTTLDESMSVWNTHYTCPGFMVVPRKPHPLGNEYHTIACGLLGILFKMELVEGKDTPTQRNPSEFNEKGKTVGLLLRLTKQLRGAAHVVILDSGFCVLQGLSC
jgi:Transposase IS4